MKNVRVKELEDFSNDFLRRLGENDEDEKIISEKPLKTEGNIYINDITHPIINNDISKRKSLNIPVFSLTKLYKTKESQKKPMVNKIYKLI